jgi:hypothetical protein
VPSVAIVGLLLWAVLVVVGVVVRRRRYGMPIEDHLIRVLPQSLGCALAVVQAGVGGWFAFRVWTDEAVAADFDDVAAAVWGVNTNALLIAMVVG